MSVFDLDEAFHGAVTVGERGQVVIPASARERLGISAGDRLLVFVPAPGHGVLLAKIQDLQRMTEMMRVIVNGASTAGDGNGADDATEGDSG